MALKMSDILGLNARNFQYTSRYNPRKAKRIADSKLLTKTHLQKAGLPIPRLYKVFQRSEEVGRFKFDKLEDSFVVKPDKGLGGEGIIVVEKKGEEPGIWVTAQGETISAEDIRLHIGDILEGRFSMDDLPDIAYIEERVRIHPVFEKYAYHGTPDIRVIVFNKVPVMAMLRIPTKDSGGRANLHQGAVGVGIDLGAGVTTYGVRYSKEVFEMPDSGEAIAGLKIPEWDAILNLAIECQIATGLGYLGADIVLQPSIKTPGKTLPKVLELNAQPGLKIQICNKAGLRRRLNRVEDLEVENAEHGIKIAKQLFGKRHLAEDNKLAKIEVFETIEVVNGRGERIEVKAKIDTGAFRSSIDENLAKTLGLLRDDNVLFEKRYESALGKTKRDVIGIEFYLAGKKISTSASVTDRTDLKRQMLIGRRDLQGFNVVFD